MKYLLWLWRKNSHLILLLFIILGLFDLRVGLTAIICMIAPLIISIYKGRFWCGNLCPRGRFYDNILSEFSRKRQVPKLFKSKYFRVLVTIIMLSSFSSGMIKNWGNLYGMGMVLYRLIIVTTFFGIILALLFNYRTWCIFCPMGSIASLISYICNRDNMLSMLQVHNSCVLCGICEKNCPMGIAAYHFRGGALIHQDCIQCRRCASACPKKSISYDK